MDACILRARMGQGQHAYCIFACAMASKDTSSQCVALVQVDVLLDNFAIYEFLLYAGLIARRLRGAYMLTQGLLISGLVLYGLTRVLQAMLLVYFFAGSYKKMHNDLALWWVLLVACIALVVLQTVTFPIYYGVIMRTRRHHLRTQSRAPCPAELHVDTSSPGWKCWNQVFRDQRILDRSQVPTSPINPINRLRPYDTLIKPSSTRSELSLEERTLHACNITSLHSFASERESTVNEE